MQQLANYGMLSLTPPETNMTRLSGNASWVAAHHTVTQTLVHGGTQIGTLLGEHGRKTGVTGGGYYMGLLFDVIASSTAKG
jgi:hypothetical protein